MLSKSAVELFRRHVERGEGITPGDADCEAHRELEAAGLVLLGRPFTGPPAYRLTKIGWKLAGVLGRLDATSPSH